MKIITIDTFLTFKLEKNKIIKGLYKFMKNFASNTDKK